MAVPALVLFFALCMKVIKDNWPGRRWAEVTGWWSRVIALNIIQAAIIGFAALTWIQWLPGLRLWDAEAVFGVLGAGLIGYLASTFAFYWWHRARHEIPVLWRLLHQIHHSPSRIEVATSFYKHPLEIAANALVSGVVLFGLCGLGPTSSALVALIAGLAELFYHWNVKTPHWVGFIIQRPESHCVHHQRDVHARNYSDLPLWDILFGTFHNPREAFSADCGFANEDNHQFRAMLSGIDVTRQGATS
jgi:sterol desaturase/sphingolipid hydroxylase (fatty acid hydroxylase superfamily)